MKLRILFLVFTLTLSGCIIEEGGISSGGMTPSCPTCPGSLPAGSFRFPVLNNKTISVQEFWQNNRAYYFVFNQSDQEAAIDLFIPEAQKTPDGARIEFKKGKHLIGPWSIPANSFKVFEVTSLVVFSQPFSFLVGFFEPSGTLLGVLAPPYHYSNHPSDRNEKVITLYNFNGVDGLLFTTPSSLWMEHESLEVRAEKNFEIKFKTKGNFKKLRLSQKLNTDQELAADLGRVPYPQSTLVAATSDSLRIEKKDQHFIIENTNADQNYIHTINLKVTAPKARMDIVMDTNTLTQFSFSLCFNPTEQGICTIIESFERGFFLRKK